MSPRRVLLAAIVLAAILLPVQPPAPAHAQGLPDLIVRTDLLSRQWVVRDEKLSATFCSVIEGGVSAGTHRLIRFTVATPNIGQADIVLGDPNVHIAADDGLYEFATCHNHFHFRHYALYELIDPATGRVWKAAKRGFCMLDTDPSPPGILENLEGIEASPPRNPQFRSCGAVGIAGNQGISADWTDTYRFYLGGQYFVLDGGDGQPPVPPGQYIIRITVNPAFTRVAGDPPCRAVDPATRLCHQIEESDYGNNVGEVLVEVPDHPGRSGFGPMAGTAVPDSEHDEHDDRIKDK